ncbi:CdaR family protein [Metaclostridioides mangenotii]|uniref:YbbR domain-containing protein n=1 Tax=Metaclostridioides mangenotii TaxID=1540 RepID=A0ABS4ECY8_9FIRM|nr:CdaR family protein [Clostridioides mangenotii]MBP1855796.1 YbbR domain-containing protein [Clostridioides mangenotii]
MINKFKHNTRIKVIALISAMVLWMYVMLAIDPQSKNLIEDVPVSITNTTELEDKGFVVYPENDLTADVYISGELSKVKNTTKSKIYVYGEIKEPLEGSNDMYLRSNVSEGVNSSLKNNMIIVNLERVVKRDKVIKVNVKGEKKDDISEIKLEKNKVKVTGPRSMVNKVKSIEADLNVENGKDNFTRNLKLTPVDESGKKVEDVVLSNYYVNADVEMFKQKTVPIKFNLKEGNTEDIKSYNVSSKEIVIKGKKEAVEAVNAIDTDTIDLKQLENANEINVTLTVPEGINTEFSTITVSKKEKDLSKDSFSFNSSEIEIRNNIEEDADKAIINTDEIKVDVEYDNTLEAAKKSDIKLYIDLTQQSTTNYKYVIKFESSFNFKNVKITPNVVEVK